MTSKGPSLQPLINFIRNNSELSRRAIMNHIINGDVYVNKIIIRDSSHLVSADDFITLKKTRIQQQRFEYYKFYKPINVVSTFRDPKNRRDLSFFLKKNRLPSTLKPIGRLDRQSTGLLLFSNDGKFIDTILHPKHSITKEYEITLNKPLEDQAKHQLEHGVFLNDGPTQLTFKEMFSPTHFIVSIHIGRNRILRRSFEFFGYTVTGLHRIQIGPISLGHLRSGEFQRLSNDVVKTLELN